MGTLPRVQAPASRGHKRSNVVLAVCYRTAVFLAFGYLIEFEEKIPSMDDTDKDDYQFNQSEVRVLNSMVDSAGVAALMLSLQAFSVLMLTVAEAGTGDSAGVVSDGINFFNKAVTAVIVFSAIRGCDQALHAETGSNVDHLLQSLSNKGITKLFEHLATLAVAVSIAGTAGILLPMLEESPLAAGLADGASHATAEELLQSLEWMAKLGPSTKRWSKPLRAVEESAGSSGDIVMDKAVSGNVTPTAKKSGRPFSSLLFATGDQASQDIVTEEAVSGKVRHSTPPLVPTGDRAREETPVRKPFWPGAIPPGAGMAYLWTAWPLGDKYKTDQPFDLKNKLKGRDKDYETIMKIFRARGVVGIDGKGLYMFLKPRPEFGSPEFWEVFGASSGISDPNSGPDAPDVRPDISDGEQVVTLSRAQLYAYAVWVRTCKGEDFLAEIKRVAQ
eukprot:gene13682-19571_t